MNVQTFAFCIFAVLALIATIFLITFGRKRTEGNSTAIRDNQSAIKDGERSASEYNMQSGTENKSIADSNRRTSDLIYQSGKKKKKAESILNK